MPILAVSLLRLPVGAVTDHVVQILRPRSVIKIVNAVVVRVSITVATFVPIRARSDKCRQDKSVNIYVVRVAMLA